MLEQYRGLTRLQIDLSKVIISPVFTSLSRSYVSTLVESLQELLDQLCAKESNCSHEVSFILFQSQHVFPSLL